MAILGLFSPGWAGNTSDGLENFGIEIDVAADSEPFFGFFLGKITAAECCFEGLGSRNQQKLEQLEAVFRIGGF